MSLLLACALIFNSIPVNAETHFTNSEHSVEEHEVIIKGKHETTVYAEVSSEFKVTIPKKITLDGETKLGHYQVSVEGDIAGLEVIDVVPEETVLLSTKNKLSVTGEIEQDKTQWSYSEILSTNKVLGNGSISAQDITAGEWNGSFNFNIKLKIDDTILSKENLTLSISDEELLRTTLQIIYIICENPTVLTVGGCQRN